jgi:hypothetical protein
LAGTCLERSGLVNPDAFAPLRAVLERRTDVDLNEVHHAFETAQRWHRGQLRRSGDPYITHPVAVATIVAELHQDTDAISAALLHDLLEDTPYTPNQLRVEFGPRVSALVEGVRALDHPDKVAELEQRWLASPLPTESADHDVMVIKIADRLHNMRTIRHLRRRTQVTKSQQTLSLVAPLAHQLGFATVKRELEELAFTVLRPSWRQHPPGPDSTRPLLRLLGWLLPASSRRRWIEEWTGEIGALSTRRARAGFLLRLATLSLPRLAIVLRSERPDRKPALSSPLARAIGTLITGATVASVGVSPAAALVVATVATLTTAALAILVLFSKTDTAAKRLSEILRAWRRP